MGSFIQDIKNGYSCKGPSITLGAGLFNGSCLSEAKVNIPLKMFNRHGLITGATGTGKTKTVQGIASSLSA